MINNHCNDHKHTHLNPLPSLSNSNPQRGAVSTRPDGYEEYSRTGGERQVPISLHKKLSALLPRIVLRQTNFIPRAFDPKCGCNEELIEFWLCRRYEKGRKVHATKKRLKKPAPKLQSFTAK